MPVIKETGLRLVGLVSMHRNRLREREREREGERERERENFIFKFCLSVATRQLSNQIHP